MLYVYTCVSITQNDICICRHIYIYIERERDSQHMCVTYMCLFVVFVCFVVVSPGGSEAKGRNKMKEGPL